MYKHKRECTGNISVQRVCGCLCGCLSGCLRECVCKFWCASFGERICVYVYLCRYALVFSGNILAARFREGVYPEIIIREGVCVVEYVC